MNCIKKCVIGEGTMLGTNVNIWDTDFHPIDPSLRKRNATIFEASSAPIIIGKNVWIGANVTVLKGVRIGDNAVVGAMSLVNKDIEPNSLWAVIPAKKIKALMDGNKK